MEPVTHILTGACLARTGFNRKAAYATLTMAIAAELPDIDKIWSLRGPVEDFQHHRGVTHTLLGLPFEAAILVTAVYGFHRWRLARHTKEVAARPLDPMRSARPVTHAPVSWGVLYGLALIALLSHLLLDYTNNYGIRPFFPFNDHWYAASIVFIFDPAIFGCLLVALVAPALFGLISSEVGARRQVFRGRGWAIAALVAILGMWTLREVQHGHAVNLAMEQSITAPVEAHFGGLGPPPNENGNDVQVTEAPPVFLAPQRALASPDPLSPFHWSTATDFGSLIQLAEVDTLNGALTPAQTTYPKPEHDADMISAEGTPLGRAYFDWSPMPIVDVEKPKSGLASAASGDPDAAGITVVTFRDPRFMGGWMRAVGSSALMGTVSLDAAGHVVQQTLNGRVEH